VQIVLCQVPLARIRYMRFQLKIEGPGVRFIAWKTLPFSLGLCLLLVAYLREVSEPAMQWSELPREPTGEWFARPMALQETVNWIELKRIDRCNPELNGYGRANHGMGRRIEATF
jgi:hypothetical protein